MSLLTWYIMCPTCHKDDRIKILVIIPDIVFQCKACGNVWEDDGEPALMRGVEKVDEQAMFWPDMGGEA